MIRCAYTNGSSVTRHWALIPGRGGKIGRGQVPAHCIPDKQATTRSGTLENGDGIRVWYDREGDFLEVLFSTAPGTFEETDDDRVMVRVDATRQVLGFSILSVSQLSAEPVSLSLAASK
jgi:hypothetical protein